MGSSDRPAQPAASPPSSFALCGIVEGFYGPTWSHENRLEMLGFMGGTGMTTYFYAPKQDPYYRDRWRELHTKEARAPLAELVETARGQQIDFHYALSPGGDISYSDESDYRALIGKFDAVREVGVTSFALFLEDIPVGAMSAPDRSRFGDLATAHVSLINRLHEDLRQRSCELAVTPTTHTTAWGDRDYLRLLAEQVSTDVPFLWTGVDIVAPEITTVQAREWSGLISRAPIIWDNFPVNDYVRWRAFLGPFRHRSPDLFTAAQGIVANPMNEVHASMISLTTLADYARDPAGYDPDRSLRRAVESLHGAEAAEILRPFLDIYGDYGWDMNLFEPLFIPGKPVHLPSTTEALERLQQAIFRLRRQDFEKNRELQALVSELEPFVLQTAERLSWLRADPAYSIEGDYLKYREDVDRFEAHKATGAVSVDGALSGWQDVAEVPLNRWAEHEGDPPIVSFQWDDEAFYVGLRVDHQPVQVEEANRIGEGEHAALVIDMDPDGNSNSLQPEDLVLLLPAPVEGRPYQPLVQNMAFKGIVAKTTAGAQCLTFSSFYSITFGSSPADDTAGGIVWGARVTNQGYQVELSIPRNGRDRFRLSLGVVNVREHWNTVWALTRRYYPANPTTFAEIVLVE